MADTEMVIKIPEEIMESIEKKGYLSIIYDDEIANAVINGKLLPKGHGNLIDTNEITAFRELECNGHNVESLDEFTTIIEADKGD